MPQKTQPLDNPGIHDRVRQEFSWTEFGYISAMMYFLPKGENAPRYADGLDAASDVIAAYKMNNYQLKLFKDGWRHWIAEWQAAHPIID